MFYNKFSFWKDLLLKNLSRIISAGIQKLKYCCGFLMRKGNIKIIFIYILVQVEDHSCRRRRSFPNQKDLLVNKSETELRAEAGQGHTPGEAQYWPLIGPGSEYWPLIGCQVATLEATRGRGQTRGWSPGLGAPQLADHQQVGTCSQLCIVTGPSRGFLLALWNFAKSRWQL